MMDLNRSELVTESDVMNNTTNNIQDLDNSIILNKSNNEVKKTEKLIEQLSLKLDPHFEKFEKDEISPEQINDVVKKELAPLRPLFISSKNVKEKVFVTLSKGNNDKYMFLNHVFKTILEESLKGIKPNSSYVLKTSASNVNRSIMNMPTKGSEEQQVKSKVNDSANASRFTKSNPYESPVTRTSPNKKLISNYDSNNATKKPATTKVQMVNINNDKSIHTKNNININIQPTFKKDKYEFTELPYIK